MIHIRKLNTIYIRIHYYIHHTHTLRTPTHTSYHPLPIRYLVLVHAQYGLPDYLCSEEALVAGGDLVRGEVLRTLLG